MTVDWILPTPDDFPTRNVGLILSAEALAGQAWADRLDPAFQRFVREVTFGELTPLGQVARLHGRLVPWSDPDVEDYAIAMAAACLAAGHEVRLILGHQRGAPDNTCTVLVSVRVAFSLDEEQDRRESWVVYHPGGRLPWPSELIDSYAYVSVPGRRS